MQPDTGRPALSTMPWAACARDPVARLRRPTLSELVTVPAKVAEQHGCNLCAAAEQFRHCQHMLLRLRKALGRSHDAEGRILTDDRRCLEGAVVVVRIVLLG